MRKLITRLVLPVTIILFATITKWWYVLVVDGTDGLMYGFPFIYKCWGFHTSISTQYFIVELLADFASYFTFCFVIIYGIRRYKHFRISRTISTILWIIASVFITLNEFEVVFPENIYKSNRNFDIEVLETGIHSDWQTRQRPYHHHYNPETSN